MKREMELLVPGGDVDCIKAAILAGADAVYCGLDKFNARNRAANISFEELQGVIHLAHQHNSLIFLTLNILILESEISALITLLNRLVNTHLDGVIVQDIGLLYLLHTHYPSLRVHASTQMTTHNPGQIKFLQRLGVERVNLSRELDLNEIKDLTSVASENKIRTEVFVHGSQCLSFSGICYMSSFYGGNSGNRGRCSQPCRDKYSTTSAGKDYPLNLKDNAAYSLVGQLIKAGVHSLKIEGRIKKYDYIYTVTRTYRKQIDSWLQKGESRNERAELHKVFNRGFSSAYLAGHISKEMFIDNPRDYSIARLADADSFVNAADKENAVKELYDEKDRINAEVRKGIKQLSIGKIPLTIIISGYYGSALKATVTAPQMTFDVYSLAALQNKGSEMLEYSTLFKRLKAINDTNYIISAIDMDGLGDGLYIPYKELTRIKNEILFVLNGKRTPHVSVLLPVIKNKLNDATQPRMSIAITAVSDLDSVRGDFTIYFKLPSCLGENLDKLIEVFHNDSRLIPWFPSVLIGEDYKQAIEFMNKVNPVLLVTDNAGVAFEACEKGISWIAGPSLNLINSFSLQCLKEYFNCTGAFISNEISKNQIKGIRKPESFQLFYSIFHPELLMTTRQCLSQQILGCEKNKMDKSCVNQCEKSSSITNTKGISFGIEKSKGNYHRVYGGQHCLNTEIVKDMSQMFDVFVVDLSTIKTETEIKVGKKELLYGFAELISGKVDGAEKLQKIIAPTKNRGYGKGI